MSYPPREYNICECCGTEFENDDEYSSHDQLRQEWIDAGTPWFFGQPPFAWSAWTQLLKANYGVIPYHATVRFYGTSNVAVRYKSAKNEQQDAPVELALAS
jgi:hypothetical protein